MKFSGKTCLMIISKVTKKTGFHPLFTRYIFRKTTEGEGGVSQIDPLPPFSLAVLGLITQANLTILFW